MSEKPVTSRQGEAIVDMANDKGLNCAQFQKAMDDGTWAMFLDSIKWGTVGIVPPRGARLHVVRIRVKLGRDWQEAVNSVRFGSTSMDNEVRQVGNQYIPVGSGEIEEEIVLINYPTGTVGDWWSALAWAKREGLYRTDPREVFAIGQQYEDLLGTFGGSEVVVVATQECQFQEEPQACFVWWHDTRCEAALRWVLHFDVCSSWFAFRRQA